MTVGDLKQILTDPRLEDWHEVMVQALEPNTGSTCADEVKVELFSSFDVDTNTARVLVLHPVDTLWRSGQLKGVKE